MSSYKLKSMINTAPPGQITVARNASSPKSLFLNTVNPDFHARSSLFKEEPKVCL